jgi:hypothetical protein
MQLSTRARLGAGLLALIAVLAYLVILDLGLFAGKVHRGVAVEGHDVGGLSFPELVDTLERRRVELLGREILFVTDGFTDTVTGADVGWNPQPFDTARVTYEVGRTGVMDSARDRLRGWFGEIHVPWEGGVRSNLVSKLIARWEREAGITVDDEVAREVIRNAIATGTGDRYEIPLAG